MFGFLTDASGQKFCQHILPLMTSIQFSLLTDFGTQKVFRTDTIFVDKSTIATFLWVRNYNFNSYLWFHCNWCKFDKGPFFLRHICFSFVSSQLLNHSLLKRNYGTRNTWGTPVHFTSSKCRQALHCLWGDPGCFWLLIVNCTCLDQW